MSSPRPPAPSAVLAIPLRVGPDGRLERTTPTDALMQLFRAMASTHPEAWPHARWFGLAEVFTKANVQLEDQQGIADALNHALAGLGVGWARVAHVQSVPAGGYGERSFRIALELAGGRIVHEPLDV